MVLVVDGAVCVSLVYPLATTSFASMPILPKQLCVYCYSQVVAYDTAVQVWGHSSERGPICAPRDEFLGYLVYEHASERTRTAQGLSHRGVWCVLMG